MIARIKELCALRLCGDIFQHHGRSTITPRTSHLDRTRSAARSGSVLEFGCGYSTLTFLNRAAFPHLERLQSNRERRSWAETIHEAAKSDQRWTIQACHVEIADSVPDSISKLSIWSDRRLKNQRPTCCKIRAVAGKQPQRPWIAIHDYEVEEYRRAAAGFSNATAFEPTILNRRAL